MKKIFTIGVYGWRKENFINALNKNRIDLLVDVRMRRGVRGSRYSFANSLELQKTLSDIGISYIHMNELSPTLEMRKVQANADENGGESKKNRESLSERFSEIYLNNILMKLDYSRLIREFGNHQNPCLLCVEGPADACHRSLIANWISSKSGVSIVNI